jgi:hypothetical protein
LLRVNKQVAAEATKQFYGANTFRFMSLQCAFSLQSDFRERNDFWSWISARWLAISPFASFEISMSRQLQLSRGIGIMREWRMFPTISRWQVDT